MSEPPSPTLKRRSLETILLMGASGFAAVISLLTAHLTFQVYSVEDFVEFYQVLLLVQIFRPLIGLKLEMTAFRDKHKLRRASAVLQVSFASLLMFLAIALGALATGFGTVVMWAALIAFVTMLLEMGTNLLTLQSRMALVVMIRLSRPTVILVAQLGFVTLIPTFGLELGFLLGGGLATALCLIATGLWRVKRLRRGELCLLFVRNKTLVLNLAPAGALLHIAKAMPFYIIQALADAEQTAFIALVLRYADGIGGLILPNVRLIYMKYFDRTGPRGRGVRGIISGSMYAVTGICAVLALAMPSLSVLALSGAAAFYYASRLALLPLASQSFFDRREYLILADAGILCATFAGVYGLQIAGIVDVMQRPESLFILFALSNIFFLGMMRSKPASQ